MSNFVFVVDTNKKPLTPCKASMAHKLLTANTDKFGFPSRYVPRFKSVKGFQTGDKDSRWF